MKKKSMLLAALCFLMAVPLLKTTAQITESIEGFPAKTFIHSSRTTIPRQLHGTHLPYRSYDGTNNNTSSDERAAWGATDIPLIRELPPAYGSGDPYNALGGEDRPSARAISNVLCDEPVTTFNARGLSAFVYVWGQFLDHDISLTPQGNTEYIPISLPADEQIFLYDIPFFRSAIGEDTGDTCIRQQCNIITAWIDGSMVYGSDATRAAWLRTFQNGKMKTSEGDLLPWNTITGEQADDIDEDAPSMANDENHTVKTYVAGDVRAAEHPGLTGLHTLFVREHNRICDLLIAQGVTNDELMYQTARKVIGGLIQRITYNEFLPALGITLPGYTHYDNTVQPDLLNTFSTAGFRLGHTMVADDLALRDDDCEEVEPGEMDLVDVFFSPQFIVEYGVEPFLKGFASHTQYETDTKINSVLRNFLFGGGFGIDLASLNIQRGRDHGLPDYNTMRQYYTGTGVTSFLEITSDTAKAAALENLYGDVNNIDLWVGILAEDLLPGKSVGTTVNAMLASQFQKLRDGDYYYYKHDPYFPSDLRSLVCITRLSDLIKRNTTLTNLQKNVFFTKPCPGENGEGKLTNQNSPDENFSFSVYPNPTSDVLNIDLDNSDDAITVKLFSASGIMLRTIKMTSEKNLEINMSRFTAGIYFLQIITNGEMNSFPVVKMPD